MCLTSNIEIEIRQHKFFVSVCSDCLDKKPEKIRSPRVIVDEFPDLIVPTAEERRQIIEGFAEKVFEKFKNSLIHGVPE